MSGADALGFAVLAPLSSSEQSSLERAGTLAKTRWAKLPAAVSGWAPSSPVAGKGAARPADGKAAPAGEDAPPAALRKAVQEAGIPHALRPAKWLAYSGGLLRKQAAPPGHFAQLKRGVTAALRAPHLEGCEVAALLANAFPSHPYLSTMRGARHVLCLLKVYEQHSEAAAGVTCQAVHAGLVAIAAFLLALHGPEGDEDAFWTLVGLLEERLPRSCVLENTSNGGLDQRVLEALLAQGSPRLAAAFAAAESPLGATCGPWFRSLFTTALPAEACARVWDSLVLEGPKVLFRVALALFKMHEPALVSGGKAARVASSLRWRVARTYNADTLMKVAAASALPLGTIKRAQAEYEAAVGRCLAEQREQLEALRRTITAARAQGQGGLKTARSSGRLSDIPEEPLAPREAPAPKGCGHGSALMHAIEHEAAHDSWATGLWTSAIRAWHCSQHKGHHPARARQAV